MADRVAVRADGLGKFRRDLKRLGGDVADVKAANVAAGRIIATAARARAPRRTGRLAASVRPAATVRGVAVRVGTPYAGVVHYGWPARGIVGRPFVTDTAQATEPVWLAVYQAGLERAVSKMSGRTYA